MVGERYVDFGDCLYEAYKEAAIEHHVPSNHVLIYKEKITGKYYHTCRISTSTEPITDDEFQRKVLEFNPFDNLEDCPEDMTFENAVDEYYNRY